MTKNNTEFKFKIGQVFKDDKRDITIIAQKIIEDKNGRKRKYYRYKCNKCGFDGGEHYKNGVYKEELFIEDSSLIKGTGCSCCCANPQVVVKGINSIIDTNIEMVKYFPNGIEDAKKYTCHSGQKIFALCPDCGKVKDKKMSISTIYTENSIGCSCSDSIPYTEKFVYNFIEQLGLKFQIQLSKLTFEWCKDLRYDFYLDDYNILIEAHGKQHYMDAWDKLEKTQANDKLKKQLALMNGIKETNYRVIDCRESTLEWIKERILEDKTLNELFDLSKIDWLKCHEFACSNIVKAVCKYRNDNPYFTTTDICKRFKYDRCTIISYLKKGNELNWCHYDANEEQNNTLFKKGMKSFNGKEVTIFKNDKPLDCFESATDLERKSESLFGTKLDHSAIIRVCKGKLKQHKGYTFKYTSDLTTEEIAQIQENAKLNKSI